jgi:hypothetical protein
MQTEQNIPDCFDVAVLMERRPGVTRWQTEVWAPVGLVAGAVARGSRADPVPMPADGRAERALWRGFVLRLHRDEAESYYYTLMSPSPQAYVVMRREDARPPAPTLVTLSFDEANAYAEGDDDVESVTMPAELAQWLEAYVIRHYVPEKRVKRKRRAWTENP